MSDPQGTVEEVLEDMGIPFDGMQEETAEVDIRPDRTRENSHTSFSLMRTDWAGDDQDMILELEALSADIVREKFAVAFAVMERIYRSVREAATDSDGVVLTYDDGTPMWAKDELGAPVERWELLSDTDRGKLLMTINTHMFEWEMAKASIWAEAMYAKAQWQEIFARNYTALPGYVVSGKPTIEDRTHWAQKNAAEARYFALFKSALSKRADGIVKALTGLQRTLENTIPR